MKRIINMLLTATYLSAAPVFVITGIAYGRQHYWQWARCMGVMIAVLTAVWFIKNWMDWRCEDSGKA